MNTEQKLLDEFITNHTIRVLTFLEIYNSSELAEFISKIPVHLSSLLMSKMERTKTKRILESLDADAAKKIVEHLPVTTAANLLRQLDEKSRKSIFQHLSPGLSRQLKSLIKYPAHSVAAYAKSDVFTILEDFSVEQCYEKLKDTPLEVFSNLIILDREQTLVGSLLVNDLIKSDKRRIIKTIMNPDPLKIQAELSLEFLKEGSLWNDTHLALPVVNKNDHFLGMVTRSMLDEVESKKKSLERQVTTAGKALGELYRIGFTSLLHSTTTDQSTAN